MVKKIGMDLKSKKHENSYYTFYFVPGIFSGPLGRDKLVAILTIYGEDKKYLTPDVDLPDPELTGDLVNKIIEESDEMFSQGKLESLEDYSRSFMSSLQEAYDSSYLVNMYKTSKDVGL